MIIHGNCLESLKQIENDSVDSLVTDPPYGIEFMGKEWDNALPSDEIWKECCRVMKPGAFGFICCIPRQDCLSRMMISLEHAGFDINFTSLYWTYATGFPKALNIGKAVDKRLGREREVVAEVEEGTVGFSVAPEKWNNGEKKFTKQITIGTHPLEGSYGGFQPKPAVEVIIVVMKPRSEKTYVDQALANGKGVVWFDDCRIPYRDETDEKQINDANPHTVQKTESAFREVNDYIATPSTSGRFPANLLVSDDVLDDGIVHSSNPRKGYKKENQNIEFKSSNEIYNNCPGDSGGYSRFFSLDAWAEKNVPFLIVPKASKKEKNMGMDKIESEEYVCDKCGNKVMLCFFRPDQPCGNCGGKIIKKKIHHNTHPTVKPLKLMSYLITMGSRPGDVILDPFAGSGTTGCAAISLDRKYILIEREDEYIEIIKARIDYFHKLQEQKLLTI